MDSQLIVVLVTFACFAACQGQSGRNQRSGPECILPYNTGTCNMNLTRYYFDINTKTCRPFTFGGCGGNLNNFASEMDCNKRCICSKPVESGNGIENLLRYFYNAETGRCEQYSFSGRGGNSNRFNSMTECAAVCVEDLTNNKRCERRPDFGRSCGNTTVRFYYDKNCDCCREFTYLGCDGNGNRFESQSLCMSKCTGKRPTTQSPGINPTRPSMCYEAAERGPCTQDVQRYRYDANTGSCQTFSYSGCGGNGNNFMVYSDCNMVCKPGVTITTTTQKPPAPQCLLPLRRGNCNRIMLRFYYNESTRSCRMFLYSGCEGNGNNFLTYRDCLGTCNARM